MELRRYNTATTIYFPLITKGATDFVATSTIATGDCTISKDGGAFSNTNSNFAQVSGGVYSLALTATEMSAKQIVIKIIDQTTPKLWEDQCIVITTVGDSSSEIPYLADASVAAVKAKTDNLPAAPAATGDCLTAAGVRTAVGLGSANLDTQLSGISSKTTNIPASPAAVSDVPTAADVAAAVLSRDVGVEGDEDTATAQTLVGVILKLTGRFKAATGVTYKSDGSTTFMTQTPTTDPSADPITELGVGA